MVVVPCEICGGYGKDRDGHVCSNCLGKGTDPYHSDKAGGGRGRRRTPPLPKSQQFLVILLALGAAALVYLRSAGSEDALATAAIGFVIAVLLGSLAVRILSNPLPFVILLGALYLLDLWLFEGAITPRVRQVLGNLWSSVAAYLGFR